MDIQEGPIWENLTKENTDKKKGNAGSVVVALGRPKSNAALATKR